MRRHRFMDSIVGHCRRLWKLFVEVTISMEREGGIGHTFVSRGIPLGLYLNDETI
jgi:hypothetical protein